MRKNCDKCGSLIENGKCSCGIWVEKGQEPNFLKTLENAILAYDHYCEQLGTNEPVSGDHYTGYSIILFKGNFDDCKKVKNFIKDNIYKNE